VFQISTAKYLKNGSFLSIFQTKCLPWPSMPFLPLSFTAQSVETFSKWPKFAARVAKKILENQFSVVEKNCAELQQNWQAGTLFWKLERREAKLLILIIAYRSASFCFVSTLQLRNCHPFSIFLKDLFCKM
jgi:hypothetical protein